VSEYNFAVTPIKPSGETEGAIIDLINIDFIFTG